VSEATRDANHAEDADFAGPVTADEARAAVQRLINSAFANDGPKFRVTIPVDKRDDDVRAVAYVVQSARRIAELEEAVRVLGIGHRVGTTLRNKLAAVVGVGEYRKIILQMQDSCTIDPLDAMNDVLANPIAAAAVNPLYVPPVNTGTNEVTA
jgi:hypothetical protein